MKSYLKPMAWSSIPQWWAWGLGGWGLWERCAARPEGGGRGRSGRMPYGRWTWWRACVWIGRCDFWVPPGSTWRTGGRGGRWRCMWWAFQPSGVSSSLRTRRTSVKPGAADSSAGPQTDQHTRRVEMEHTDLPTLLKDTVVMRTKVTPK